MIPAGTEMGIGHLTALTLPKRFQWCRGTVWCSSLIQRRVTLCETDGSHFAAFRMHRALAWTCIRHNVSIPAFLSQNFLFLAVSRTLLI